MKAATTNITWDREDIRLFEHALKVVLDNIEAAALGHGDYKEAYNQAIDHMIKQLSYSREE